MACGVFAAAASDQNSYNRAVALRQNTQIVRLSQVFLLIPRSQIAYDVFAAAVRPQNSQNLAMAARQILLAVRRPHGFLIIAGPTIFYN